ncbi:type 2 isopentenyl-diphosphate Delta-isomerase [Candidatus Hecatella orcuttiae]|jgi:isopentenyl-diphosphate delta-isomerase|uniref:type 2 isopentenyl-diphosphate Delta-isomerase n=1 Tax=Candidatus Hecatella orcuttiae TaxID=1935119 RepID=UPI0028680041|nr:type 2 isopentenyl-diphosphate Delta-isomerase [Candidatus Hecatella orcuttiae]
MVEEKTAERKTDHIRICLTENVQARTTTTGLEDVHLIHDAAPEARLEDVDTAVQFFGHKLSSPILISAMTGGTREAAKINASLAEAAEKTGVAMGVGSQRVALEDPSKAYSFQIARQKAPHAFLIANLGCAQLAKDYGVNEALKAVDMIEADALALHLNPLHEAVQPEGQTDFRRVLKKIKELSQSIDIPIIAKETGAGISAETALKLKESGVRGIEIGGAGGTSWAAVEYHRARKMKNIRHQRLGQAFWDWGIPTVVSLVEVRKATDLTVIATGGVRTGMDIAKTLALGAQCSGIARPFLKLAVKGSERVVQELNLLTAELKIAIFLVGGKSVMDLAMKPLVVTGKTAEWLRVRGFNPEAYAKRGEAVRS